MDIKNRRNLPDGFPFRNKAPGQFTLIQSKLSRPSKSDTSLGRFASCAGTFSNQIALKFGDAYENGHDYFASVRVVSAHGSEIDWNLPPGARLTATRRPARSRSLTAVHRSCYGRGLSSLCSNFFEFSI